LGGYDRVTWSHPVISAQLNAAKLHKEAVWNAKDKTPPNIISLKTNTFVICPDNFIQASRLTYLPHSLISSY